VAVRGSVVEALAGRNGPGLKGGRALERRYERTRDVHGAYGAVLSREWWKFEVGVISGSETNQERRLPPPWG